MIEAELAELLAAPNALLKATTLEARSEPVYQQYYTPANRWEHNSTSGEMYNWRSQFVGRPALEFKHCALIIKIRRNEELQKHLDSYFRMWAEEAAFLVKALNTKWLVSACDTFLDYSDDEAERAAALAGAMMIKTVKIYETELRFRFKKLEPAEWPDYKLVHLFDGVNSFNIGYGDVIVNLKTRIQDFARRGTPAAMILNELFERVCTFDTAFSRWRAEHVHEPTRW